MALMMADDTLGRVSKWSVCALLLVAGGCYGPGFFTDIPPGPLAIKNVADIYLYPNTVQVVKVTGAQLHEWLEFNQKDYLVVATKSDKLSSNELTKQVRLIETEMPETKIIPYSAQTGKGRDSVWSAIVAALK